MCAEALVMFKAVDVEVFSRFILKRFLKSYH